MTLLFGLLISTACIAAPIPGPEIPVNPAVNYETTTGFRFRAAMSGQWHRFGSDDGVYTFGQRPEEDGSTLVVEVRPGRFVLEKDGPKTPDAILRKFQQDMSEDASRNGFKNLRDDFSRERFRGAECLRFDQMSEDSQKRTQTMKGMICMHPSNDGRFIRLAFSQRVPNPEKLKNLASDEESLISSLEFLR